MASTTTRKPRTRKNTPKAVEPKGTDLVPATPDAEKPVTKPVDPATLERLNTLTDEAQAAFVASSQAADTSAQAFWTAAEAIRVIREEKLVEAVHGDALSFADYCVQHFNVSRDLGDKYVRAGQVIARLRKELGEDAPLPKSEGVTRLLGAALNADKNGRKKLTSKVWTTANDEAQKRADEKATKGGFVAPVASVTVKDVTLARKAVLPVNGSTQAPRDNTDHLSAKLRKIHAESFAQIEWATFISIVAETAEVAHVAAKGILRSISAK